MNENEEQKPIRIELKNSTLLNKLCDMTGTDSGAYKGFALFYVDNDGFPQAIMRVENQALSMVLDKMLYNYVEQQEALKDAPSHL